jgi:UDP-N-acetylmuramyl pentapeptide phosphotransferase/UDP-N-acetylglucosamine-1-phosphate transferase
VQLSAATPILLLALPILDTLSVMVQRVERGTLAVQCRTRITFITSCWRSASIITKR